MRREFTNYMVSHFSSNAKIIINNFIYHYWKYNIIIYFRYSNIVYLKYTGSKLIENIYEFYDVDLERFCEEFLVFILTELKNGNFTYA